MIEERFSRLLRELKTSHRLRHTRAFGPSRPGLATLGERTLLDVSSNDYLGLSGHPALAERACEYARVWGVGARASRLIRGTFDIHAALEKRLAVLKGTQSALVLGAGFTANSSVLAALLDAKVLGAEPLVLADRLNHASMHEGCRLAGVRQVRYRHLDMNHLEDLLKAKAKYLGPRFILSESVFSMDGDRADVRVLAELADRYGAFLYLDEAHATGVLGPGGRGLSAGVAIAQGLVMGTFSKALGGYGSFVCCSSLVREYLVNRCAGFIFSTALPPPALGAVDAALDLVADMDADRQALERNARDLRERLAQAGLDTAGSSTQIIPVLVGPDEQALEAMRALEDEGILAVAVRPPTVPPGTSRLRLSLTAAHTTLDVARLAETLIRLLGSRP
ncbi:8-amino-7-oxononanoate synthase [Fundidesulfovibrio butyratiphilus]